MKRIYFLIVAFILSIQISVKADEGMWIPLLLEQLNYSEMQTLGLKLTADEIYSINQSCIKDAIVLFGGGCTAEIISNEGLILTNHHCGYSRIQSHSSLEFDYLTNGFWARKKSEELKNPGLKATILIRMEDVTAKVLEGVNNKMTEAERKKIISANISKIKKDAIKDTHYKSQIKAFDYGNEYYMFISEVFTDIRLVGAPPSNIGKFGGDTDNWMWPRHTGDFSIFRIYANKDNKPADYSSENVPYKPKYHLPISLKGYDKNDFTFVFGYPGRTQQYLTSYAVKMITQLENPAKIKIREKKLEIIHGYMNQSDKVRIQYSAKAAGTANYWKKMIGENRGIKKLDAINKKETFEKEFYKWTNKDKKLQHHYGNLLDEFNKTYETLSPLNLSFDYFYEAGYGLDIVRYANKFRKLIEVSQNKTTTESKLNELIENYKKGAKGYFKNYYQPLDKKVFSALLQIYYNDLGKDKHPDIFKFVEKKFDGDFSKYADYVYKKSVFSSEEKMLNFLNNYNAKKYKNILKDPAYKLASSLIKNYVNNILPEISLLKSKLDSLQRVYVKAIKEMSPEKRYYYDANSTLRIAYGKVDDYKPKDGVQYEYFTTLEGIIEKENPQIYDYVVEKKLKELYTTKNYGKYADKDGQMHVCFIASNHTTGGNSGSPVLNSEGQLIGINFDRNWEGTMSDIMYDPDQCRNISLDIRYCLFIIDKFAGASNLIEELTIIE